MGICDHKSSIDNTNQNNKINKNSNINNNANSTTYNKNSSTYNKNNTNNNKNNNINNNNNNSNNNINNNSNNNINYNSNNNPKNNNNNEIFVPKNDINNELVITMEQSEKIIKQTKIYLCKINFKEVIYGTGVLCKIPFPDKNNFLPALITKEHVFNKDQALQYKKIDIIFDDKIVKNINFNTDRIIYSLSDDDLTIIEILPEEDKIFHFYDLEIIEDSNKIINEPIYILQYPEGLKSSFSYGRIFNADEKYIMYDCPTKNGSSGGAIISLKNYHLIGIHERALGIGNVGTLLNESLEKFNLENLDKINKNNYIGCIICEYNVKSTEEFYLLHDYNNKNLDTNKELNKLRKKSYLF